MNTDFYFPSTIEENVVHYLNWFRKNRENVGIDVSIDDDDGSEIALFPLSIDCERDVECAKMSYLMYDAVVIRKMPAEYVSYDPKYFYTLAFMYDIIASGVNKQTFITSRTKEIYEHITNSEDGVSSHFKELVSMDLSFFNDKFFNMFAPGSNVLSFVCDNSYDKARCAKYIVHIRELLVKFGVCKGYSDFLSNKSSPEEKVVRNLLRVLVTGPVIIEDNSTYVFDGETQIFPFEEQHKNLYKLCLWACHNHM